MTISAKCLVCKNADRRRLVELGWNGGMGAETISRVLGDSPSGAVILKHIKEHADEGAIRSIPVEPERSMRDRVYAIQKMQVDEIERRLQLAQQRVSDINKEHENDADWTPLDYSAIFDILGKDMQAAVSSIIKTQSLSDRREKSQGDLKLGLFDSMVNAGLAPKALVGAVNKQLTSGEEDDDESA